MKKNKGIILLGGILIVLLAAYFGIARYQSAQAKKQEAKEEAAKIYVTDISNVQSIQYTDGAESFSFTKEDGNWEYDGDRSFPLDETYITSMVSSLSKIEAERKLSDPDELSAYGLDTPADTITLTDGTGKETVILVGDTVGDGYYLTTDNKTVYTAAGFMDTLVWDLNSMALLDTFPTIASGNLVSVKVTEGGTETTYDKNTEEELATSAGGLGTCSLSTMVTYGATEEAQQVTYGLDSAHRITVKVTYEEDEEEKTLIMYIGALDESGENYYVQMKDSGMIYTVGTDIIHNILNK